MPSPSVLESQIPVMGTSMEFLEVPLSLAIGSHDN